MARDNRISSAVGMFNGAELLFGMVDTIPQDLPPEERGYRVSLALPAAVVCLIGMELALKSTLYKQGTDTGRLHDLFHLYGLVESGAQKRIEEVAAGLGVDNVRGILQGHRNALQEWRYREDLPASLFDPRMRVILRVAIMVRNELHGEEEPSPGNTQPEQAILDKAKQCTKMLERTGRKASE